METTLAKYDVSKFNVLVPTQEIQQVSPWHAARTSIVSISPDSDAGDIFKVGSRYSPEKKGNIDLFCLGKPALMRIAAAAGIVWNWKDSGPVSLSRDYVCYKAVGALRLPDGSWQPIMATKEIDLSVIEDELREQFTKKAESGVSHGDSKLYDGSWQKVKYGDDEKNVYLLADSEKPRFIDANVRTNLVQWRKNKLMRAETGAILRVIRAALGIKSQYTEEELKRPFIVPRIDFAPDYNDPAVRQALIENGVPAMAQLFGQSAPAALTSSQPFNSSHPALMAGTDDYEQPFHDVTEPATIIDLPNQGSNQSEPEQSGLFDGNDGSGQPDNGLGQCTECGAGIKSASVIDFSQKKYGRALCYKCQQSLKEAGLI